VENFRAEKFAEDKFQNSHSGDDWDLDSYYEEMERWLEDPHYYESHEDEANTRRDFLNSLDDIVV
jgi:hypothetical protein